MIVEIISVGTELLLGNIVNTNAQYISRQLAHLGLDCFYQTVVGDNPDRIKSALDVAYTRCDMVILTGGLGPTRDDLTKEMLMDYFHKEVVLDDKAWDMMKQRLTRNGFTEFSDSQKKQAYVPKDSLIMYNHHGTAPGCIMNHGDKYCMLFPGPPKEMQPMFEEYAVPYLRKFSDKVFVSINIKMYS
uniref:molybdopterin-binding protein n=1 Tax=Anaerovibrio sp. TaxID=1872532 RepID=UPI0025E62529